MPTELCERCGNPPHPEDRLIACAKCGQRICADCDGLDYYWLCMECEDEVKDEEASRA